MTAFALSRTAVEAVPMGHAGQRQSVGGCGAIADTVMNPDIKWLEQRINLLQTHLQELNELSAAEEQARQCLKNQHQHEKTLYFSVQDKPVRWAELLAEQVQQQASLANTQMVRRTFILARQRKEVLDLEQWIEQEMNRLDKATGITPKASLQQSRNAPPRQPGTGADRKA